MEQGNIPADGAPGEHLGMAEMTFDELQAITNSIPGGVAQFALDEALTLLYANDGFYKICGYSRVDFAGRTGMDILKQLVALKDIAYILKTTSEQFQQASEIRLEYQITPRNGGSVWIQMNASKSSSSRGFDVIQCVFVDISSEKLLHQELQLEQERFRIISEQFNDVFFEYNRENDTVYISSKWEELFGYPLPRRNVASKILTDEVIYDDDKRVLHKIIDQAKQGIPNTELEIRLRKGGGGYVWTSLSTTVICDEAGNPVKIIGKITDIDTRIREREKLISSAQRDPFTKLYNKTAVEAYIRSCLRTTNEHSRHALMIIDIDNFKGINDNLGHLFGDDVLTEISAKLRTLFRSSDIIGRFGGDEFIVFLKNVGQNSKLAQKAKEVCDIFRETYTGENKDFKISGSVGISVYPEDGENFYELFKKADLALYDAKNNGKDGFVIYREEDQSEDGEIKNSAVGSFYNQSSHRFTQQKKKNAFALDLMDLLIETKDIFVTIKTMLQMVGLEFGMKHVYICESGENGAASNEVIEWSQNSNGSWDSLTVDYPSIDLNHLLNHSVNDGVFFCEDVDKLDENDENYRFLKKRGVKSFLQYAIYDGSDLAGIIGFDNGIVASQWPAEVRKVLDEISKIIGLAYLQFRLFNQQKCETRVMQSALESMNIQTYVINTENYELLHFNAHMMRTGYNLGVGDCCYRALRKRESPCENCPVSELKRTGQNCVLNAYDSDLHACFSSMASPIDWSGCRQAALLCHMDVTYILVKFADAFANRSLLSRLYQYTETPLDSHCW